tara:strand:+ start:22 stop:255 length:234 start_codon:yes stop_codon:yes gene_type:complete
MNNIKKVKRFVISVKGIENNTICEFVNKKNEVFVYNQKVVFNQLKEKFEKMNCWTKYKTYTNTNNLPTFVKSLNTLV